MLCRYSLIVGLLLLFVISCGRGSQEVRDVPTDSVKFHYAKLIQIYCYPNCKVAELKNPWKPTEILHRYVLVDDFTLTENLPKGTVVRVPLKKMTVFTSVHASLMDELGVLNYISAVCDFEYIRAKNVIRMVRNGKIKNAGSALNPNVERIISGKTDAMLVSPFEQSGYGSLEHANIPLIECADYMETSALGRAEWMKFFGLLVGKEQMADSLFQSVEKNYLDLKAKVETLSERPKILCDLMNGAAWYVPGGKSTMGQIYQDAGSDFLFRNNSENGSVRLSFESVYNKARNADVWFIKYGRSCDFTYQTLAKENSRYTKFQAYQKRRIFGCNTYRVPFYDEEPFHPDLLLADFVFILHPELLPGHQLKFYQPLK